MTDTQDMDIETQRRAFRARIKQIEAEEAEHRNAEEMLRASQMEHWKLRSELARRRGQLIDQLKAMAPVHTKEEMQRLVREGVLHLLATQARDHPDDRELSTPKINDHDELATLREDFIGKGWEGRVRKALNDLEAEGYIRHRVYDIKGTRRTAFLWQLAPSRLRLARMEPAAPSSQEEAG